MNGKNANRGRDSIWTDSASKFQDILLSLLTLDLVSSKLSGAGTDQGEISLDVSVHFSVLHYRIQLYRTLEKISSQ